MKKKSILFCCILTVLIFLYAIIQPKITHRPVVIHNQNYLPSNYHQNETNIELWTDDSNLYFYGHTIPTFLDWTRYYRCLCVFKDGAVSRLKKLDSDCGIIGLANGYFYYWKFVGQGHDQIYSYDLSSGKETCLYTGQRGTISFLDKNGVFYIAINISKNGEHEYLPAYGTRTGAAERHSVEYQMGDYLYTAEEDASLCEIIYQISPDGRKEALPLPFANHRTIIPCEKGLLIHNEGAGKLLYWINAEGGITELFSVPCMTSVSAVTVHGTKAYLSFLRYAKSGEIGQVRYENDTSEGTYIIDLESFCVKKVSDKIYCGLYNFDDTCLYACDECCHIYKLDFNADIIEALIS